MVAMLMSRSVVRQWQDFSGDGRGGREGCGRGVRFNIAAIQSESDEAKQDQDENNCARGSERGGHNGRGFGRGAYGDHS